MHQIIEERGSEVFYVFDNLSALVDEWATDELLANFFQVTCPFLFELDTVTYFALTRGRHATAPSRASATPPRCCIDVYHVEGRDVHPPAQGLGPLLAADVPAARDVRTASWSPVFQSGDAAARLASARRKPLAAHGRARSRRGRASTSRLMQYREAGLDATETTPEIAALKQELCRG